jgi:hypothetical protein
MSTTFGIVIKNGKLLDLPSQEDGLELSEDENTSIIEIAFRSSRGMRWTNVIAQFLPSETKVYPLDNTPQGIYTIGDILKDIENDS